MMNTGVILNISHCPIGDVAFGFGEFRHEAHHTPPSHTKLCWADSSVTMNLYSSQLNLSAHIIMPQFS